ncbi:MAG: DUF4148 domain-containing protein [Rubrivivax sp.]|nr:DUF4148 domain-containing protein [Rubrivivax sp.]
MKTTTLFSALVLSLAAGGAFAQEATVEPAPAAKAAVAAPLTREAVRADAIAALRSGEVARRNAEAWNFERQLPASNTRLAKATAATK